MEAFNFTMQSEISTPSKHKEVIKPQDNCDPDSIKPGITNLISSFVVRLPYLLNIIIPLMIVGIYIFFYTVGVLTVKMKKGGPRIALHELCKKCKWPLPSFDSKEWKPRLGQNFY